MRLFDDGTFTLNTYTLNPRRGNVAIGDASEMNGTATLPWSRFHLVHGQNSDIFYGYRPELQNGVMLTRNSQQAYMGHLWYDNGVNHLDPTAHLRIRPRRLPPIAVAHRQSFGSFGPRT